MSNPGGYSVIVIAKNEARNIARCLRSISRSDDVIVVDDNSDDDTAQIAEALGARVLNHPFVSFAAQRNWALENAGPRHPWVLMLDADEALTPEVEDAIVKTLTCAEPEVAGYLMCRRTMFLGRLLGFADGFPVWIMRLVHQGRAKFVASGHGEVPAPPVDGVLKKIKRPFLHYPFSRGLHHWLARHNEYSSREAELEFRAAPVWTWRDTVFGRGPKRRRSVRNFARRLPLRPLLRFCHHYFWKWGILDGRAGLEFSALMAAYERMIVLKRRELELAARTREQAPPRGSATGPLEVDCTSHEHSSDCQPSGNIVSEQNTNGAPAARPVESK
jgi:glycosyltransferase involved in cell wall biosynthesis